MTALDAFWHLANFLAPAWVVSALLALLHKLIWRRELKAMAWRRLALWGGLGGTLALVLALLLLGHDGKMAGYALLLLGVVLPQWALTLKR
ncbi:hypothetical protein RQP53_17775 [Paucibacter sp. APW11]|uniref:Uncharacterized protein n=1 Tax=Roseateles aquae TaxID=3077235 RepID=A0ABU3PG48_9BURK|nr:hypothetical protein [Paucibacter sp. APW11]MDT9001132.1 hypothetical protein [Paucibacter sp. APW11]